MTIFFRSALLLFAILARPVFSFAQDCAPPMGPGISAGGYAVQGRNDCFMAADVNSGFAAGHSLNPDICPVCDQDGKPDPLDAMYTVRQCLEEAGYVTPGGGGTRAHRKGFPDALCKCNELVFGKKFVCDQMSAEHGVSICDLTLLEELLANQCLVIASFRIFNPADPSLPYIGTPGNHAVSVLGANPGAGSVSTSDPNNPDVLTDIPLNPNGTVPQGDDTTNPQHRFGGGGVPLYLHSFTIKCPASEAAQVAMETGKECSVGSTPVLTQPKQTPTYSIVSIEQ